MAQHEEPMDIDVVCEDKENSLPYSNVLNAEENISAKIDVKTISSKASNLHMSKSLTDCVKENKFESSNLYQSLDPALDKTPKSFPLRTISSEQQLDDRTINISVLRPLDETIVPHNINLTQTVNDANENFDHLSLPSTSGSPGSTPEVVTPTNENPKPTGSPILRGLRSVLSMFRPSQSPIPTDEIEISVTSADVNKNSPIPTSNPEIEQMVASTPLTSNREEKKSVFKDGVAFDEDLERALRWEEETTIIFSKEKIPVHKLLFPTGKLPPSLDYTPQKMKNKSFSNTLNITSEPMDISYNNSVLSDKTVTELCPTEFVSANNSVVEKDDSIFVDCETTLNADETLNLSKNQQNLMPEKLEEQMDNPSTITNKIDQNYSIVGITNSVNADKDTNQIINNETFSLTLNQTYVTDELSATKDIINEIDSLTQDKQIESSENSYQDKNSLPEMDKNFAQVIKLESMTNNITKSEVNENLASEIETESLTKDIVMSKVNEHFNLEAKADNITDSLKTSGEETISVINTTFEQETKKAISDNDSPKLNTSNEAYIFKASHNGYMSEAKSNTDQEISSPNIPVLKADVGTLNSKTYTFKETTSPESNTEKISHEISNLKEKIISTEPNVEIEDKILETNKIDPILCKFDLDKEHQANLTRLSDKSQISTLIHADQTEILNHDILKEAQTNEQSKLSILNTETTAELPNNLNPHVNNKINIVDYSAKTIQLNHIESNHNIDEATCHENDTSLINAIENMDISQGASNDKKAHFDVAQQITEEKDGSEQYIQNDNNISLLLSQNIAPKVHPVCSFDNNTVEKSENLDDINQLVLESIAANQESNIESSINKNVKPTEFIDSNVLLCDENIVKNDENTTSIEDELHTSENTSPYVSLTPETNEDYATDYIEQQRSSSPPIKVKNTSYDLNFDEIDDPFNLKSENRNSTSPVQSNNSLAKNVATNCTLSENISEEKYLHNETYNVNKSLPVSCTSMSDKTYICDRKTDKNKIEKQIGGKENQTEVFPGECTKSSDKYSEEEPSNNVIKLEDEGNISILNTSSSKLSTTKTITSSPRHQISTDQNENDDVIISNSDVEMAFKSENVINEEEKYPVMNISNISEGSEEKNITIKEVNTDEEDTAEGPDIEKDLDEIFYQNTFSPKELKIQENIKDKDIKNNDDIFIDAEAFEYLMNQNNNDLIDSGKESLFLKFDPLYANRVNSDGVVEALKNIKKRQNLQTRAKQSDLTLLEMSPPQASSSRVNIMDECINEQNSLPSKLTNRVNSESVVEVLKDIVYKQAPQMQHCEQNLTLLEMSPSKVISASVNDNIMNETYDEFNSTLVHKPTMIVPPAINNVSLNSRSTPPKAMRHSTYMSPAIAVIDRLISISANNSYANLDMTLTQENREQEEADFALSQLREMLTAKEIEVHNLKLENRDLMDKLSTFNSTLSDLEKRSEQKLKNINELTSKLTENIKVNKVMQKAIEEYERTISYLVQEKERDKENNRKEKEELISERDEHLNHLSSVEAAFSDLHSKYEKSKQVIMSFKYQEQTHKKQIEEANEKVESMYKNYETLQKHAATKLEKAYCDLDQINKQHEADILKIKTLLKRKDMDIASLEENLAQKTKVNKELTIICDDLINKVGKTV